jgi:hypothetical protein
MFFVIVAAAASSAAGTHIIEPHEVMPMARETIALRALLAKDMNRRGLFPERPLEQHHLRGAARRPVYHLVRWIGCL